jgi:hypothetical protein
VFASITWFVRRLEPKPMCRMCQGGQEPDLLFSTLFSSYPTTEAAFLPVRWGG